MRKRLYRVKQIADQTFYRAERSELLTDDLVEVEQRIEFIKQTCAATAKKLTTSLVSLRNRKTPEYQLAAALTEKMLNSGTGGGGAKELEYDLLRHILSACAKLETSLGQVTTHFETDIELRIVHKLNSILEKDLVNVPKLKANLKKCILDMDSAKTRFFAATKNTGANNPKAESIQEELDEAETKVDQCRDSLATEMYLLITRECEIAQVFVDYIELQKKQHQEALLHLDETLPSLYQLIADNPKKPMFGQALDEHVALNKCKIAFPVELCTRALLEDGMLEEGLFRVTGGASKVKRLKSCLDAHCIKLDEEHRDYDPHVLAGVLKLYLRELPEPLLTFALYNDWLQAARVENSEARLQALRSVLGKLPSANFDNLRYLVKFLTKLCDNKTANKMSSQNIAIVIGPNILWSNEERLQSDNIGINMNTASAYSVIVDTLVSHCEYFFPGPEEFYVSSPRNHSNHGNVSETNASMEGVKSALLNGHRVHSRASSADANVIITDPNMSRSQSTDSMQEQGSGGSGGNLSSGGGGGSGGNLSSGGGVPSSDSPRPITRRKNKPAPGPPVKKVAPTIGGGNASDGKPSGEVTGGGNSGGAKLVETLWKFNDVSTGGGSKTPDVGTTGKTSENGDDRKSREFVENRWKCNDVSTGASRTTDSGKASENSSGGKSSEPNSPRVKTGGTIGGSDVRKNEATNSVTSMGECNKSQGSGVHTKSDRVSAPVAKGEVKTPSGGGGTKSNSKANVEVNPLVTTGRVTVTNSSGVTSAELTDGERVKHVTNTRIGTEGVNRGAEAKVMSQSADSSLQGSNPFDEDNEAPSPPVVDPSTRHNVENIYATYDRKAAAASHHGPPRPTPAPRSVLTAEDGLRKPAVPERPAVLARPLSSSFRIQRPGSVMVDEIKTSSFGGKPATPSPTEPRTSDCDTNTPTGGPAAVTKPSKPPKPAELSIPVPSSHSRSLSDGNTIDTAPPGTKPNQVPAHTSIQSSRERFFSTSSAEPSSSLPHTLSVASSKEHLPTAGQEPLASPTGPPPHSPVTRASLPAPPLPPTGAGQRLGSCSESTNL